MKTIMRFLIGFAALGLGLAIAPVWAQSDGSTQQPKSSGGLFEAVRSKTSKARSAPSADPFLAGQPSSSGSAGVKTNAGGQPAPMAMPSAPPPGTRAAAEPVAVEDPRRESDLLIIAARRSLAVGDISRAKAQLNRARGFKITYQHLEDSPDRVLALVAKAEALNQRRAKEGDGEATRRAAAELMLEESEGLLRWKDLDAAERLARDTERLGVNFSPFETKPADLLARIAQIRRGGAPAAGDGGTPADAATGASEAREKVLELVTAARQAQAAGDWERTEKLAREAASLRVPDSEFNANDDRPALVLLDVKRARQRAAPGDGGRVTPASFDSPVLADLGKQPTNSAGASSPALSQATAQMSVEEKKLLTEIADKEVESRKILEKEPKRAVDLLKEARGQLETSAVSAEVKQRVERRLDRAMTDAERYIRDNKARIELDDRNKAVLDEIDHERNMKLDTQQKLAKMVDDYNKLMDERRYAEAEVVAKRAVEMAPHEAVAKQILVQSRLIRQHNNQMDIQSQKEDGFLDVLANVDRSSIPNDKDIEFGDPKKWADMTARRGKLLRENRKRSAKEIEIDQKLKTPVSLEFHEAPLSQVIDSLAKLAQINVHLDPQGLAEEGVNSDTPVTIDLSQPISLKSALSLILQPLRLAHVVKHEVLMITSEALRGGEVYTVTYNVADLVIPIPNFVPNGRMGMQGALRDAYNTAGYGGGGAGGSMALQSPLAVVASRDGSPNSAISPGVLANAPGISTGPMGTEGQPAAGGPGGLGGVPAPDFDSLIDLITSTISPQSWDEVGGPGTIEPFRLNLSLVISQTQDVHEQIVDLLQQLRRLQDLQVAIEVRFITVNDNFFERIGISWDFNIKTNIDGPNQNFGAIVSNVVSTTPSIGQGPIRNYADPVNFQRKNTATVGLAAPTVYNSTLDIPVKASSGSFTSSIPTFGGFDPATAASTGFAILSDIESFFFITAAQGDRRTNIMQAPKVTLFNGQSATISDQSFSPFVISVVPVVGDFAVGQQPVIMILPEGTNLTVQAVVSSDRRFVRLTVVPYFSTIEKVDTFKFTGSRTTRASSSQNGPDNAVAAKSDDAEIIDEGTTIQLPTLAVTTVTTTVSVPDGGTVLLGGIKRLREGRNEFGVPFFDKLPYIKRLFSNIGIGRETSSLMLMVTPRIIIQEEEEQLLGIEPQLARERDGMQR